MQMAGFPYNQQYHLPYAPDLAYLFPFDQLPPAPSAQQEAGNDALRDLSCLPSYDYPTFDAALQGSLFPYREIISKVNNGGAGTSSSTSAVVTPIATPNLTPEGSSSFESDWKLPSADSSKLTTSSSSAGQGGAETKTRRCGQKKRRDALRCHVISESAQSKGPEAGKSRKLRKRSGAKAEEEEKAAPLQIPTGYIHVRARRGEATDSHSLAERVRRERIREKMKMLQDLVPGCDKVVGKALLLEEIINYVRSLQNQVEFLSMKLASMDPWGYDEYGLQFDGYMAQTEWHEADGSEGITMQKLEDMSPGVLPNIVQRTGLVQTTAMADATKSCSLENSTPPYLLHDQEGPSSSFPADQDINEGNLVMQVGDPAGQGFLNLIEFDMSFQ